MSVLKQIFATFSPNEKERLSKIDEYNERNSLWSVNIDESNTLRNQEYYEDPAVVDAYDIVGYIKGEHHRKSSSYLNSHSFELIELARSLGAKKFLDVGCGAGFLRYALQEYYEHPVERYVGVDISSEQIRRAKSRFNDDFRVGHAADITSSFIREFDIVHIHSVLNFMSPEKQLQFLKNMLQSGVPTIIRFTATEQSVEYCPTHSFKNLGNSEIEGKKVLSQIGFCILDDVQKLVRKSKKYQMTTKPTEFSVAPVYNSTAHDGAIMIDPNVLKANSAASRKKYGVTTLLKAHSCTIWPKGISLPEASVPSYLQKLLED
ncbi:class I SAM-dependent methyltransferase [uncultured Cohaesibacter sp.]|uniref:class I SAM-dependent methyltransferase n=1 Tax=uncultured Cohaesibacter sp. TaxID=1002546 RepID=UPI00292F9401|nr:class I SAM-dependent methyltransferase [uncultured Cohaesibacter sp.]